jgi:hypothetical protein
VEETLGEVLYHREFVVRNSTSDQCSTMHAGELTTCADPKKYLIISRASGFNVKLRSQYREHIVGDEGGQILHGIDLHPHPEPVTDEKADRGWCSHLVTR